MNRKIKKECESGCEFILPDYMGDIKKLLMSSAKVIPTGKFVGEGSLEISGVVEYEILYADSDNKLTAINTSSDFTEVLSICGDSYIDSAEETRISNLKIRITGPRKMLLKAELESSVSISEENPFVVEGDAFADEEKAEKCTRVINYSSSIFKKSGEREYAEVAEKFSETEPDEIEVVAVSAAVHVENAKAGDGEVLLKGRNIVSAVLKSGDRAAPFKIKKSIPFEEKLELDGVSADMLATASGFVSSVNIGLGSENGECVAVANIIAEYNVEVVENLSETVVTDAYFTDKETLNKYTDADYYKSLYAGTKELSFDVKGDKESLLLGDAKDVICACSEVRNTSAVISKNGCQISGEVILSGVACEVNVDGSVTYIPIKLQAPFEENVNIDCQLPDDAALEYSLSVSDTEIDMDSESLVARCTLSLRLSATQAHRIKRLASCESIESDEAARDKSTVTVYYPKVGERLFDVAKKYKTTSARIALDNKLSESALSSFDSADSLVGINKLIIR